MRILTAVALSCFSFSVYSDTDSSDDDLLDQSLESLSQIIVSASKREESLMDAPLSASILTAEKIRNSGATSIAEALRLVPGVIVREQANGIFDVHLRGLDNTPEGSVIRYSANSLTLVMIDNRLVFNHYVGGTPWQSLPIDLVDIERIEVITGAAAALYGPNAVTGVIHIFTKDPRATKNKLTAQAQGGSSDTYLGGGDAGFAIGENWSGRVSYNGQHRSRTDSTYYDFVDANREKNPANINNTAACNPVSGSCDFLANTNKRYPDKSLSLERNGVNAWFGGDLPAGQKLDIALGYLESRDQEIFNDNAATPFTTVDREDFYLNTQADLGIWNTHLDYTKGSENNLGSAFFDFDYQTFRVGFDAGYVINDWTLQPLLDYSWREYSGFLFMGNEESMEESAAGLRAEYKWDQTRVYAAVRGSSYDFSNDIDWSWLAGITHRATEDFVLRASYGRAYQEPFMAYTYQDLRFPGLVVVGNEDLDRVYVDTAELGLRWQINKAWSFDAAVFNNQSQDMQLVYLNGETRAINGLFLPVVEYQNVPTEADQIGTTAQLMYQQAKWQASVFLTVQDTDLSDQVRIDSSFMEVGRYNTDHKNTPETYGGFTLNYTGIDRWIIDVNGYWLDNSQQINSHSFGSWQNYENGEVDAKLVLNSKITWLLTKELNLFLNVRNIGDDQSREFAYADEANAIYSVGFEWKH